MLEYKYLTYILFGVSLGLGKIKGPDMVFLKYLLAKTGWFPNWEPRSSDVLSAALRASHVHHIEKKGKSFFYIIPLDFNLKHTYEMLRVYRANGIFPLPHKSKWFETIVFRVRDRGQQFMYDVYKVNHDAEKFYDVITRYNKEFEKRHPGMLQDVFGKIQEKGK